jgi:hypothetical protein
MIGMAENSTMKLARRVARGNVETRHHNRMVTTREPVARQRLARSGSATRISNIGRK